ncbi:MAG: UbiA family prenyltransferase [Candidatus Aenigmarchaeota archaeon]|nr:UbiA family prenyltransferase [Candidatus Aenigmarchaeota archaeon]
MNPYLKLMRPEQWYKNCLVFLALVFSVNFFNTGLFVKTMLGFASLSLVSSSYYILNDLKDIALDKAHPEKKHRPLAAGRVTKQGAVALSGTLLITGLCLAQSLSIPFFLFATALFTLSALYSLYLKHVAIVDIHIVAINFLIRAVSGAVLIEAPISPWLIFSMFFVALFLAAGKRMSDRVALGSDAKKSKVYSVYTEDFLRGILYVSGATVIVAYSLYAFLAYPEGYMMASIPVVSFMCFRFLHFAVIGNIAARQAHRLFFDKQLFFAFILWALISFAVLYAQA